MGDLQPTIYHSALQLPMATQADSKVNCLGKSYQHILKASFKKVETKAGASKVALNHELGTQKL